MATEPATSAGIDRTRNRPLAARARLRLILDNRTIGPSVRVGQCDGHAATSRGNRPDRDPQGRLGITAGREAEIRRMRSALNVRQLLDGVADRQRVGTHARIACDHRCELRHPLRAARPTRRSSQHSESCRRPRPARLLDCVYSPRSASIRAVTVPSARRIFGQPAVGSPASPGGSAAPALMRPQFSPSTE